MAIQNTMKYKKEIVDKIYEMYVDGEYTQKQICEVVGIKEQTFIDWKNNKTEFSELLKSAEKERMRNLAAKARKGLNKLVDTYTVTETHEEFERESKDGVEVIKKTFEKKVTKTYMPNVTAVMYALNNSDSEYFQHKEHKKVELSGSIARPVESLSEEEIDAELAAFSDIEDDELEDYETDDESDD